MTHPSLAKCMDNISAITTDDVEEFVPLREELKFGRALHQFDEVYNFKMCTNL